MKNLILISILMALVVLPVSGYAMGIASDYLENNIYKIEVGTTNAEYGFRLQNMEDQGMTVKVGIDSDGNIASIRNLKDNYYLPSKTTDNEFMIDLSIPSDAEVGDIYKVSFSVDEASSGSGQVVMGKAITMSFDVQIVEQGQGTVIQQRQTKSNFDMMWILIIVLIVIIAATSYMLMKKRGKRGR